MNEVVKPPQLYPDLEAIRAIQRSPEHRLKDIQAEYMRQAKVIIPLLKQAGRIEEWVFWAGFVAFCGPAPRKKGGRTR